MARETTIILISITVFYNKQDKKNLVKVKVQINTCKRKRENAAIILLTFSDSSNVVCLWMLKVVWPHSRTMHYL